MGNRTKLTNGNRKRFIDSIRENGNISAACRIIKMSRTGVYDARESDPSFADEWDEAVSEYVDSLEQEADRRAYLGVDKPVFYKGDQIATTKEYSDTLMMFRLKALRPYVYRERQDLTVTGPVEVIKRYGNKPEDDN